MQLIGAALGNDLDLRTAEPAVLRIVAIRDDLHLSHRIFTRCDHRCAAPDRTHRADAIDCDAVGLILAARILDLRTVLGLENPVTAVGAGPLVPRQLEASASALL